MKTEEVNKQKYEFKAEIRQLLDILVHSLYTNREIFIRELISNSSDALDKLRFESNRGTEILDKDLPFEIRINVDEKNQTIEIFDTGIGLTKEEMITNIGTIAKSGSSEFINNIKKASNGVETDNNDLMNLIGKFGVGFYSVFMVAKEVIIKSKSFKPEEPAIQWKSDGLGTYEIIDLDEKITRGTRIIIFLKEETKDFAEKERIKSVIKKHSNFISHPIYVDNELVNTISALWREPKFSIKKEQYDEFFKFLSFSAEEPLSYLHISVDAPIQFNSILFIPKKNYDFFGQQKTEYGPDLYVRRVLIQKKFKELLPEYLSFIEGVVDSEDIPLNISRETLQENQVISKIGTNLKNQIFDHLAKMAIDEKEKYNEFWKEHSKIFKFGYMDFTIHEKLADLLRFSTSSSLDSFTSLSDYVSRVQQEQKEIYYVIGQSRESIEVNPHLEIFKRKGIEVIYLYEPVDEFVFEALRKYKDLEFKSVENADFYKLDKIEDKIKDEKEVESLSKDEEKDLAKILLRIEEVLKDKVTKVVVSKRLTDSPSCLVSADGMMSSNIQKIMSMINKDVNIPKKVMEINKDHKIIRNLIKIYAVNPQSDLIDNTIEQLYESSLLLEGYLLDPHKMVTRVNKFLEKATEVGSDDK